MTAVEGPPAVSTNAFANKASKLAVAHLATLSFVPRMQGNRIPPKNGGSRSYRFGVTCVLEFTTHDSTAGSTAASAFDRSMRVP